MLNHTKQFALFIVALMMLMTACGNPAINVPDDGDTTPAETATVDLSPEAPSQGEEQNDLDVPVVTLEVPEVPLEEVEEIEENVVELSFGITRSNFHTVIEQQIEQFRYETGIDVTVQLLPDSNYVTQLTEASAAGEPIDIMVIRDRPSIIAIQPQLLPIDGMIEDEDFLVGAKTSGSVGDNRYGIAWQRILCTSSYSHLTINNQSSNIDEALKLIDFLTQIEQQVENFEEANWYPTRYTADEELTRCGDESSQLADISIPLDQIDAPEMEERYPKLAENLQEVNILRDGVSFDISRAVALVDTVLRDEALDEKEQILAGAIPVGKLPVERFVDQLPEGVLLGGLLLNEFEDQLIPQGDYGVRWQAEDPNDVTTFSFVLIDENGEEIELDPSLYTFGNVNGKVDNAERLVSIEEPIARFAKGSSESCWYWWLVCGCIRTGN